MNITVRLYKLHDYDLIYLYKNLQFPVRDAMKEALKAYVRNEPVFIKLPIKNPDTDNLIQVKNAQFHIKLDDKEEADLIDFLKGLKNFYRNSFLKNLLRGYLAGPAAYVYENEPDIANRKKRMDSIENNMLNIKELKLLKKRKKRKKHIILTVEQKKIFDLAGALDDNDLEVIINDRDTGKN
ncbi:hypothetical protein [Hungatella hathewayi]|uniref:hypothetical protein n=1 Tax=Hungatella hathewayi TaxID=154046 RepID=UPI003562869D